MHTRGPLLAEQKPKPPSPQSPTAGGASPAGADAATAATAAKKQRRGSFVGGGAPCCVTALLDRLIHWQGFENVVLAMIGVSCVIVVLDNPLNDPASAKAHDRA